MRKLLALITLSTLVSVSAFCSNPEIGSIKATLGTGVSTGRGFQLFHAAGHYMLTDRIEVGLRAAYNLDNEFYSPNNSFYTKDYTYNGISFATTGSFHINEWLELPSNLDLYGGLDLGMTFWSNPNDASFKRKTDALFGVFAGAAYFFNNKLGASLEIGQFTNSGVNARVGVIFKL
ncbi:MAG: outer membrane beta-barrel protein [Bacteroidales bacterium]|nr:outer membrane beta-barrel protein [Bacteroidales bacterium]